MKKICGWCGKLLKKGPAAPVVSHGICEPCSSATSNGKLRLLQIDQWSSGPHVEEHSLFEFEQGKTPFLRKGDAASAEKLGVARHYIVEVLPGDSPPLGTVWYQQTSKGLKVFKTNYDSSD